MFLDESLKHLGTFLNWELLRGHLVEMSKMLSENNTHIKKKTVDFVSRIIFLIMCFLVVLLLCGFTRVPWCSGSQIASATVQKGKKDATGTSNFKVPVLKRPRVWSDDAEGPRQTEHKIAWKL